MPSLEDTVKLLEIALVASALLLSLSISGSESIQYDDFLERDKRWVKQFLVLQVQPPVTRPYICQLMNSRTNHSDAEGLMQLFSLPAQLGVFCFGEISTNQQMLGENSTNQQLK
jgi:hypothetical protein